MNVSVAELTRDAAGWDTLRQRDDAAGRAAAALHPWAWQQNLRALWPHRDRMQHVVVMPSTESAAQAEAFADMLHSHVAPALLHDGPFEVTVHPPASGTDYEDYKQLFDRLREAIDTALDQTGLARRDVCVDVTAGLKPFSAVAAIVTLNSELHFSYVGTNTGAARSYDAWIDPQDWAQAG